MGIFQPAILVYQRVIATLHLQIDVWKNRFPFEMASQQVFELLVLLGKTFSGVKGVRLFLKFRNHHFFDFKSTFAGGTYISLRKNDSKCHKNMVETSRSRTHNAIFQHSSHEHDNERFHESLPSRYQGLEISHHVNKS